MHLVARCHEVRAAPAPALEVSEPPDPNIPQDPGIPGWDTVSETGDRPTPDEKDEAAQEREHPEADDEGQLTPPREGSAT